MSAPERRSDAAYAATTAATAVIVVAVIGFAVIGVT
jgi:hypothetical protein